MLIIHLRLAYDMYDQSLTVHDSNIIPSFESGELVLGAQSYKECFIDSASSILVTCMIYLC